MVTIPSPLSSMLLSTLPQDAETSDIIGAVVSPMTVKSDVGELGLPAESVSTAFSA